MLRFSSPFRRIKLQFTSGQYKLSGLKCCPDTDFDSYSDSDEPFLAVVADLNPLACQCIDDN